MSPMEGKGSENIKTFVLFDTETTGLPSPGNKPKITELCFVALLRDELLTRQRAPRVLNKLLLCFNPNRQISRESSLHTGLHNDALESLPTFSKQAFAVCAFLKNLPQPVCLIAHNGHGFDFPLLLSELESAQEDVPDISCADSLDAFRMLDGLPPVSRLVQKKITNCSAAVNLFPNDVKVDCKRAEGSTVMWTNGYTDVVKDEGSSHLGPQCQKRPFDCPETADEYTNPCKEPKLLSQPREYWHTEETTPKKSSVFNTLDSNELPTKQTEVADKSLKKSIPFSLFKNDEEITYENGGTSEVVDSSSMGKNTNTIIKQSVSIRRQKRKDDVYTQIVAAHKGKQSYALRNIYFRVFSQEPEGAHTAEGDCDTLLKLIQNVSSTKFCLWCDQHVVPLRDVTPMY